MFNDTNQELEAWESSPDFKKEDPQKTSDCKDNRTIRFSIIILFAPSESELHHQRVLR